MNKFFLILIFFLSSCGYQAVYVNKNIENSYFQKINLEGDKFINRRIINTLPIKESDKNQNKLFISSSHQIEQSSKNSKGEVVSFKTIISINLEMRDKNSEIVQSKNFVKEFTYGNKKNKFELVEYQNSIRNDLVNKIISEIMIFLNS